MSELRQLASTFYIQVEFVGTLCGMSYKGREGIEYNTAGMIRNSWSGGAVDGRAEV